MTFKDHEPEIFYSSFFLKEFRLKKFEEEISIKIYFKRIVDDIYINFKEKCTLKIQKMEEHPFYTLMNKLERNKLNTFTTCDEIFLKYLYDVCNKTNKEYFLFIFKFVILFRECINKYKNIELENSKEILHENLPEHIKEFTQIYDAEQTPELCNEFISEYLLSKDYFGFRPEFITEFIEITQHFCYWLYENNYTSSKLSMIN